MTADITDKRVRSIMRYFDSHGWPVAGRDAERDTAGIVSSRFLARYSTGGGRQHVLALGAGLYAPVDKAGTDPVPVSRDVAQAVLALEADEVIDDHDHLRLFKLAMILERKGLATIRKSRTTRAGIRRQTIRLALNEAGRSMLEARARLAKDEF